MSMMALHAGWQCVRMESGQGNVKIWCCRVHFLHSIRPHPLTLSPYVQMLARGLASALGWIGRPYRGREKRGVHGRGWPATQLPAQVSTGPHEHLLLPLLFILSAKRFPPPTKYSSDRNGGQNDLFNGRHISFTSCCPNNLMN